LGADRCLAIRCLRPIYVGRPVGPLILGAANAWVGWSSLKSGRIQLALAWNTFVAVMGCLVPIVWPKFIDVGMSTWPHKAVFLWLFIYAFESAAFFFSAVAFVLKDVAVARKD